MLSLLYVLHFLLGFATIIAIMLQRGSEGGASPGSAKIKMFSARGRANSIAKYTALLAVVFVSLNLILVVVSQKQYKAEQIKEDSSLSNIIK